MSIEKINDALNTLESELIRVDLWSDEPPTPEQLASREPFGVDTMTFEQWLQWIFIPKLREMINMPAFNGMAHSSDIHTMADYLFKDYPENTDNVTKIIQSIDKLLNEFGAVTIQ